MAWPRLIRWRYSLRALLIFITLFMLWGGYHTNRARQEAKALAVLERYHVGKSYHGGNLPSASLRESVARAYSKSMEWLWRERCVTSIYLSPKEKRIAGRRVVEFVEPDQEFFDALAMLPNLQSLSMTAPDPWSAYADDVQPGVRSIPEGALERILARTSLRELDIRFWRISDRDCHAIAEDASFRWMQLVYAPISEEAFAEILTRTRASRLKIADCGVSGERLGPDARSDSLRELTFHSSAVSEALAGFIARSPRLTKADLLGGGIDDEFVERLGDHPALRTLTLRGPATDDSVDALTTMPRLQAVILPKSISSDGLERLRAAKPGIQIVAH